jgi:L-asparaginase II
MPTPELRIVATRGGLPESEHHVVVAVVNRDGQLVASSGDCEQVSWWRSAAKPFQALPIVQDGAAERFALSDEELALACASHSSEPRHLQVVSRFMDRLGISDDALSCGPHPPLSVEIANQVIHDDITMTARWSNCSGKHTGMLALALHHGWPVAGYQDATHPVQQRILAEVEQWTGLSRSALALAPDGCTVVCFGLPIRSMAVAYARLGSSRDPAARRIVSAMLAHPYLIAGTGRLCTDLMQSWPGEVIAKVGALGIYCATIPRLGLGIALKVEDGDTRAAGVALLAVLRQILERSGESGPNWKAVVAYARPEIRNSRGLLTGTMEPSGALRFS